jgi:hypothetical protein
MARANQARPKPKAKARAKAAKPSAEPAKPARTSNTVNKTAAKASRTKTAAKRPAAKPVPAPAAKPAAKLAATKPAKAAKKPTVAARPAKTAAKSKSTKQTSPASDRRAPVRGRGQVAVSRPVRASPVVAILDAAEPVDALRRFLAGIDGEATSEQAHIALGAAQLLLLPIAREHRGGSEVKELVDLVLDYWERFGERRRGFHAQEFLRNALAAIGDDRERLERLVALVPEPPPGELLFHVAAAHALARDREAMLSALERALDAGVLPAEVRRDADFSSYANDPELSALLTHAELPRIPVDIEPYLPGVRAALDSLVATLDELREPLRLRRPARLDEILEAERAGKISLPNDYRALLTCTDGLRLWEHEFFGAAALREQPRLRAGAQACLEDAAFLECIPIARWGQPTDWLLYDPRGRLRAGRPGYVLRLADAAIPIEDLPTALAHVENLAREALGNN